MTRPQIPYCFAPRLQSALARHDGAAELGVEGAVSAVFTFAHFRRLRYNVVVNDQTVTHTDVMPSAAIGDEAEVAAWNALSRDEQAPHYRDVLADPACDTITNNSMSDILASARQRVAARRHG